MAWVEDEIIVLPGPAEWWSDGYDAENYGFKVPEENSKGYFRAWEMLWEKEIPVDFSSVFLSDEVLMVLPANIL